MNLMKPLFKAVLAVGCVAFSSQSTWACYCIPPKVSEAFEESKAVFLGAPFEIIEPKTSDRNALIADRAFTIKFKVLQSWKGVAFGGAEFSILWLTNCYECPPLPDMNKTYLIYAAPLSESKTWSMVAWCSRIVNVPDNENTGVHSNPFDPYLEMKQLTIITTLRGK